MTTVASSFNAFATCLAEAFIPQKIRLRMCYPEPPEFSDVTRQIFRSTPDLRSSREFLPRLDHPHAFGTCVLPGYAVVSGDYKLKVVEKPIPLFEKDHIYCDVNAAVLQIEKNARPVHFEIWAVSIGATERRAHANWFPLIGDFMPGAHHGNENVLNLEITHWIRDARWKAEVLRRLQQTGECLVGSNENAGSNNSPDEITPFGRNSSA